MQLTVSLTLELPANAPQDVASLEAQIWTAGLAGMAALLIAAVRALETRTLTCPACGAPGPRSRGTKPRVLLTRFGRVVLPLRRLCCRHCAHRWRPAAPLLSPLGRGNLTPALHAATLTAGSSWPFAQAAEVLRTLCGAQISAETVRQVTEQAGQRLAAGEAAAAERLVTPSAADVRAERQAELGAPLERPAPPVQAVIGWDGGWVASRDQPGGMEGKLGVVYTGTLPLGAHGRQRLTPRRYVGSFGSADEVGALTYRALGELGATGSPTQVVLGDGAEWIKEQAAEQVPEAVKILDWAHLSRKVRAGVRAVCAGRERRAEREALAEEVTDLLWKGEREGALGRLRAAGPGAGAGPRAWEEALSYLEEQGEWIGNYAAWRRAGYPVGSGFVERAVAVVINGRLKRRGGRWWRQNANGVLALRLRRFNGEWQERDAA